MPQSATSANGEVARASSVDHLSAATARPPVMGSANPGSPEYIVGEADVLRINVWKEPEISQQNISVRPDGMISLPLVGVVSVRGMTPSQIQDVLKAKLMRFIDRPQVTVTVVDIQSKSVYLTGEVQRPGVYSLIAATNVVQLVVKGGGFTPYAHRKSVVVLRNNNGAQEKIKVNLAKVFRGEAMEQNIELLPGDTVVVP
jgi:polysaccharide export outer membrane protein